MGFELRPCFPWGGSTETGSPSDCGMAPSQQGTHHRWALGQLPGKCRAQLSLRKWLWLGTLSGWRAPRGPVGARLGALQKAWNWHASGHQVLCRESLSHLYQFPSSQCLLQMNLGFSINQRLASLPLLLSQFHLEAQTILELNNHI